MTVTSTCSSGTLRPLTRTPALTTVWTPPAFCSTRFHAGTSASPPYSYGWQDQVDPEWYSCVPPEWDAAACQSLTFSPALQCPHGWTVAASKTVLGPDLSSITFATCCMTGFTASLFWDGEKCSASVNNFPLVVLATNDAGGFASPLATAVSTATLGNGSLDHRGIVIGWQQSDLATASTVPSNLATSHPTLTSTSSPTAEVSPSNTESKTLSSGAIAGIAIGGVVGVVLILAAIFVLFRRRRASPGEELDTNTTRQELPSPPPFKDAKPLYQPTDRHELGSGGPGELGSIHEMASS
ncbi:hypothetical protein QBC47DRAFT_418731 [Echria macrotheca]|uniref:Uncharacterized protein n=1 Tax=Echria macrotheca TaxID=438768 RepID=A0AAJ0F3S4_9PEZI|nr:hypothetical protein QBC47DRAFT_418731 [Echria macrotheca]